MEPYREESLVTKYALRIKENREKRKQMGDDVEKEPQDLIFDSSCGEGYFVDENGRKHFYPWQYTNLLSVYCVQDIFGDDYDTICRLLQVKTCNIVMNGKPCKENLYYREQDIIGVIDILSTLAKSNFVNVLRPHFQFVKDDEPVYTSSDVMNMLGIGDELLRKFRQNGYLTYVKYNESDKIWYRREDIEHFLSNPNALHKSWK